VGLVISIFYLFSVGYNWLSMYLVRSGAVRLTTAQAQYMENLTAFDYMQMYVLSLLNIAGAITLFFLRKKALYFLLQHSPSIFQSMRFAATKDLNATLGGAGLIGAFLGFAVSVGVCIYTWRLYDRGVLRSYRRKNIDRVNSRARSVPA
jgi:hypothetical protein